VTSRIKVSGQLEVAICDLKFAKYANFAKILRRKSIAGRIAFGSIAMHFRVQNGTVIRVRAAMLHCSIPNGVSKAIRVGDKG
jgi:hypothetical protein